MKRTKKEGEVLGFSIAELLCSNFLHLHVTINCCTKTEA